MNNTTTYWITEIIKKIQPALILFISIISFTSYGAIIDEAKVTFSIKAIVTASGGCTFDQKGPIGIDFGTVYYSTLGGNTLKDTPPQLVASTMTCTGDYAGQTQLLFNPTNTGVVDYQGDTLMQVIDDKSGNLNADLGIRLLVDDIPQDVGKAFDVDMKAQPVLKVELVQTGDGKSFVSGETFSGTATLTMTFL